MVIRMIRKFIIRIRMWYYTPRLNRWWEAGRKVQDRGTYPEYRVKAAINVLDICPRTRAKHVWEEYGNPEISSYGKQQLTIRIYRCKTCGITHKRIVDGLEGNKSPLRPM